MSYAVEKERRNKKSSKHTQATQRTVVAVSPAEHDSSSFRREASSKSRRVNAGARGGGGNKDGGGEEQREGIVAQFASTPLSMAYILARQTCRLRFIKWFVFLCTAHVAKTMASDTRAHMHAYMHLRLQRPAFNSHSAHCFIVRNAFACTLARTVSRNTRRTHA
jgi:hypothetical protein